MRIVSGGQTGVDRAALDVALELGLECGGWCPAGRWAEDGRIPDHYPLRETPGSAPAERTERNVRDSDATLVLAMGAPRGGTAETVRWAVKLERPHLLCDLEAAHPEPVAEWLRTVRPRALNVAGPRESEAPGTYEAAAAFLPGLLVTAG